MKKVLFATTALIATAGMAAADVKISGYGRFGAVFNEGTAAVAAGSTAAADADAVVAAQAAVNAATTTAGLATAQAALAAAQTAAAASAAVPAVGDSTDFASRLRIQIDVSAETQSGIKFGARQRIQTEESGTGAGNGVRFYMTTGGLTVGAGNIIGAIEGTPGLYMNTASAGVGLEGNGYHSLATNTVAKGFFGWDLYSSGGAGAANGVEVSYSANGLTVYASSSETEDGVSVAYKFGDYTVAVAGTDNVVDTNDKTLVTFGGKLGAADFTLAYADNDGIDKVALKGGTKVGAATYVYGFVADEDSAAGGSSYGLGVSHDLGGASIEAGITQTDYAAGERMIASAGFFFKF